MQSLRVIYAGTPAFAVPALQHLLDSDHEVVAVLTQPDRPAGRGRRMQASPVKQSVQDSGIPILQPLSLREQPIQDQLNGFAADLMVVTAYGLILPEQVLTLPKHGCWNIHASLLPRWRGAAPIQRAIEAGDKTTGITIMQMDRGLDTGDMLLQHELPVSDQDTSASLHESLAEIGAAALIECINRLAADNLPEAEKQNPELATYAHRLDKAEAQIDWSVPANVIDRQIRAFNPWPVSWTNLLNKRTRIWQAQPVEGDYGIPGELRKDRGNLIIACSEGGLNIQQLQPEGSRVISARDWLNAHGSQLDQANTSRS